MDHDDLRNWSKRAADWAHGYHAGLRDRPVRPRVAPGSVATRLPAQAPEDPEPIERIFTDFETLLVPAMTHWQHPRFFAYFPANAAPASMLAEQLANAIAAQCMLWQTSPAATELEAVATGWMRRALGLPERFSATIHDSATVATLSAVITMREAASAGQGNANGLFSLPRLRLYASEQTHSSVDKAVRVAGLGQANLVRIPTDATLAMAHGELDSAIRADLAAGHRPAGVILAVGGTSVGACDRLRAAIGVAKSHGLPVQVDAAWAGSAMICPEFRALWEGVEEADSVVVNPHKWLGVQFDCSIQFLTNPAQQIRSLSLKPAYLATAGAATTDYSDWTLPLGRRFRALKLWMTLRAYGLQELRRRIRNHVAWASQLAEAVATHPRLLITTPPVLSLFTFAHREGDTATDALLGRINDDGRVYLTPSRHFGKSVIRVQVGQFDCTRDDVMMVARVLRELA